MNELLDGLWQASLWLAVGVVLLAVTRPLLVRLGGAGLAYRSWWLLPLLLATLLIPLPQVALLQHVPTLPLKVVPEAVDSLPTASLQWPLVLLLVWTLGTGACLLRDLRAQRRFERNLGALRPRTDGSWQASGDPGLPALVGLWRPRIVVGPDFDQQFTAQEQALILQHEHSHRRNGDHWANGVLLLMRAVFWFHPLLPWAARRFLRDQELACDARTIAPQPALRGLYASTLLKAQLVHPVAPAVCHWRSQPVLKERIAMLKQSKRKALPWVSGQVLVVGLCLGVGAVAWASQGGAMAAGPTVAVMDREIRVDKMPPPSYPKSAFEQSQTGVVVLRVDVDAQGAVSDVRVVSATNPGVFEAVSIAAARSWTYRPALKNGRPVAGAVRIPITFAMDESDDVTETARVMRIALLLAVGMLAGCATQERLTTVDTRNESVGHQRLHAEGKGGSGQVQAYTLGATEGYRMPQLCAAPDPQIGDRDPRTELAPTTICLQVVIDAEGAVERSLALVDRSECAAGAASENAPLLQAAQEAVAMWKYSPAAVCHFAPGKVPSDRGDCEGAERVEPVPVSLLYAFTFEIVKGQNVVRTQGK